MFSSPESALRFAFRMDGKDVIAKQSYRPRADGHTPQGVALTVWDYHAQAAMIMSCVERLDAPSLSWVYLEYGDEPQRYAAASFIASHLLKNPSVARVAKTKSEIFIALTKRSVGKIAKAAGVTKYKAWKIQGAVNHALYPIKCVALDSIWEQISPKV